MKLQKLALVFILIIAGLNFTGCSMKKSQPTGGQVAKSSSSNSTEAKKSSSDANFTVIGLKPIAIDPSSREGVYLSGYIETLRFSPGVELTGYLVGTPKWGSITALPNGNFRYFAPANVCDDEVQVELRTNKGTKKVIIPITVIKDSPSAAPTVDNVNRPPVSLTEKSDVTSDVAIDKAPIGNKRKVVTITSPRSGYHIAGRICPISGRTMGYSDDVTGLAYIKDPWGNIYLQPCVIQLTNGRFCATVFLGDQYGHGVGDTFRIWVKMKDGKKSPSIEVTRDS